MSNGLYVLDDDGQPLLMPDVLVWARWIESHALSVQEDWMDEHIRVSTVFLGIDNSWGVGDPILWETMVFGGRCNGYVRRYTSRADANAGHGKTVAMVKATIAKVRRRV